ncbi:MAG: VOC family protein [Chthonomonas sp.]|nr:VOC family protein [Chthonomonas sp.]
MAFPSLGQVALCVADIERAKAFYVDVIGLTHLFDAGPKLCFLDAGGVRIMLSPPEGAGAPGANSVLYYRVADVDQVHSNAVRAGAVDAGAPHKIAQMPDHELWMAFVKDPDGNLVGLMEERR